MSEDRAAVTMMDLALKAVSLRLRELEEELWQMSPDWRDRTIPRIQRLKRQQRELEARLNRLHVEAQETEEGGSEEIFPAVQEALVYIMPDLVRIERQRFDRLWRR